MPATESKAPPKFSRITFGGSLRLLSEDYFIRELAPGTGLDQASFRALCRALGVPLLHTAECSYVDYSVFMIALKTVLRPGAPDFAFPNALTVPEGARRTLSPQESKENSAFVNDLLLVSRTIHDFDTISQKTMLKDASERLRAEYERRGLKT